MLEENYTYFDHEADTGIIGRGKTVEAAFISAAQAVFAIMADPNTFKATEEISINFEEEDIELAFVTWLNLLITLARVNKMVFKEFKLERKNNNWQGIAKGEAWSKDIPLGTEVKGATLTMLSVQKLDNNLWEAKCVVDV